MTDELNTAHTASAALEKARRPELVNVTPLPGVSADDTDNHLRSIEVLTQKVRANIAESAIALEQEFSTKIADMRARHARERQTQQDRHEMEAKLLAAELRRRQAQIAEQEARLP